MSYIHRRCMFVGLLGAWSVAGVTALPGCSNDYTGLATGANDFLSSGRTRSFFSAIQVDPRAEDSAGPQFTVAADLDGDGLTDLVSAWNQSQPVQVHLQRRSASGAISFETVTLAGNVPVVRVAGLDVADFDADGRMDIAVLVKESGLTGADCLGSETPSSSDYSGVIVLYLGPDPSQITQALAWNEVAIESSRLAGGGTSLAFPPEEEGYTSMAVGDMDLDGDPDIVVAWDPTTCNNDMPEVLLFTNQGRGAVRDGSWNAAKIPDSFAKAPRLADEQGIGPKRVKDVALGDIDRDGDLDIVVTYPDAVSLNVRWYRNPATDTPDDVHISDGQWQTGVVGQISPKNVATDLGGADAVALADIDGDGILDVVVRSTGGRIIQWLKGPSFPTSLTTPTSSPSIRHIPWQVYTLAEFIEREPDAIAIGDVNGDGQLDVIASAGGALVWFSAPSSVFNQWQENTIVQDGPQPSASAPSATDPGVSAEVLAGETFMNSIAVTDLNGDGRVDLVVTLDRSGLSGLSNDALVWFRSTR